MVAALALPLGVLGWKTLESMPKGRTGHPCRASGGPWRGPSTRLPANPREFRGTFASGAFPVRLRKLTPSMSTRGIRCGSQTSVATRSTASIRRRRRSTRSPLPARQAMCDNSSGIRERSGEPSLPRTSSRSCATSHSPAAPVTICFLGRGLADSAAHKLAIDIV